MAHIVILGAGAGGVSVAYELREVLGREHRITVVNRGDTFQFVPSNPWVALGWRQPGETQFNLRSVLQARGIELIGQEAERIDAHSGYVHLAGGAIVDYDYLVIATGSRPAPELAEGVVRSGGVNSVCTLDQSCLTHAAYEKFLADSPSGRIVVGAFQGASCFVPVYEYVLALAKDLERRRLRDRVSITFITPEPHIGHLGLGGVGESRALLEAELHQHGIDWITNARTTGVEPGILHVREHRDTAVFDHRLEFRFSMLLPTFRGAAAVADVAGLCNDDGLVIVDRHQRSPVFHNIYAVGTCTATAALELTPVPTGLPVTGYMIESMVRTVVRNIHNELAGKPAIASHASGSVCLIDLGDGGTAFVAMPQALPREVDWAKKGKWVHWAKAAFERYFIHKLKTGSSEPVFEKYMLKAMGIVHTAK